MFGLFGHKKRVDKLKEEVKDSFEHVKKDFTKIGNWIQHFDDKHIIQNIQIDEIKQDISNLKQDLEEMKKMISFFGQTMSKTQTKKVISKNIPSLVQTDVQTAVQTTILDNLTVMERAILWALINSDIKLSYEDLAALMGKDKSTIRGQINTLKQKNKGLIKELRENNGKKRLYIDDEMKEKLIKSIKVRVKAHKKSKSES